MIKRICLEGALSTSAKTSGNKINEESNEKKANIVQHHETHLPARPKSVTPKIFLKKKQLLLKEKLEQIEAARKSIKPSKKIFTYRCKILHFYILQKFNFFFILIRMKHCCSYC